MRARWEQDGAAARRWVERRERMAEAAGREGVAGGPADRARAAAVASRTGLRKRSLMETLLGATGRALSAERDMKAMVPADIKSL